MFILCVSCDVHNSSVSPRSVVHLTMAASSTSKEYFVSIPLAGYRRENGKMLHITIAFPGLLTDTEAQALKDKVVNLHSQLKWPVMANVVGEDNFGGNGVVTLAFDDKDTDEAIRKFQNDNTAPDHVSKGNWTPHVSWKEPALLNCLRQLGECGGAYIEIGIVGSNDAMYKTDLVPGMCWLPFMRDDYPHMTPIAHMCHDPPAK